MKRKSTAVYKFIMACLMLSFSVMANARIIETQSISCFGGNDGQLMVVPTFGAAPYTFEWSNGSTDSIIKGLTANDYSVRVKCSETKTVKVVKETVKEETITLRLDSLRDDGFGGMETVYYDTTLVIKNNITTLVDSSFVVDYDTLLYYTLSNPEAIENHFNITPNSTWADGNNGEIKILTTGGTGEYTYTLRDSTMDVTTQSQMAYFKELASGTYYLLTTDLNQCSRKDTIAVEESNGITPKLKIDSISCFHAKDASFKIDLDTATVKFPVTIYFDDQKFKEIIGYVKMDASGKFFIDSTSYYTNQEGDPIHIDGLQGGAVPYVETITKGTQKVIDRIDTIQLAEDVFEYDTIYKTVTADIAKLTKISEDFYQGFHTLKIVTADDHGYRYRWYVKAPTTPGTINYSQTNNVCYGGKSGALQFAISGSYDVYSYTVSGPNKYSKKGKTSIGSTLTEKGFEFQLTGLASGKYTITVTDQSEKCKYTQSFQITEPDEPIRINYGKVKDALCLANSGAIELSRIDGTQGGSNIIWTLGSLAGDTLATDVMGIDSLATGMYYIKVTDSKKCTVTDSVQINAKEKNEDIKINFGEMQHSICTADNGFVKIVAVESAEYPISYKWSNDETTKDIYNLAPDMYYLTITDANGCEATDSIEIKNIDALIPLNIFVKSKKDVVCTVDNGEIIMGKVTGGEEPYSFQWSNGETTKDIYNLAPDMYYVTVTDANGCTETDSVNIIRTNTPIRINFGAVRNVKCPFVPDGEIEIYDVENAIRPISYKWSNGDSQQVASGLEPGMYSVEVTDGNGCVTKDSITVYAEKQNCIYNIITPNGDGYNDYLDLTDICVAAQMEAQVFNDLGKLVATLTEKNPIWDPNDDQTTPPTGAASVYTVFITLSKDGTNLAKMAESITVIYEK